MLHAWLASTGRQQEAARGGIGRQHWEATVSRQLGALLNICNAANAPTVFSTRTSYSLRCLGKSKIVHDDFFRLYYMMFWSVLLCCVMVCYVCEGHVMKCDVMQCCTIPYCDILSYVLRLCVMVCWVCVYYEMLCYAMVYYSVR